MDRGSWIKSRQFSKPHLDGVSEFMTFVSQTCRENEEIFCPCHMCSNHICHPKGIVEDHLIMNHIDSTYTRWIYHGEPVDVVFDSNVGHGDDHISLNEYVAMHEDEEDPDDRIPEMVEELYTAGQQDGQQSLFAAVLEEMKKEIYPGSPSTRFSFVVKLLHIKSFHRISNAAFTEIMKLLSSSFPACSIPESYDEAKKVISSIVL